MKGKILLLVLALAIIAALNQNWQNRRSPAPVSPLPEQVDYTMSGVQASHFDASGKLRYELQAEHLAHYPKDDRMQATQVVVIHHGDDGQRTRLTAPTATAWPDRIELHDEVLIHQLDNPAPVELHSRDVLYLPDSGKASSTQATTLFSADWRSQSQGFEADLNQHLMTQYPPIRDRYEPEEKPAQ